MGGSAARAQGLPQAGRRNCSLFGCREREREGGVEGEMEEGGGMDGKGEGEGGGNGCWRGRNGGRRRNGRKGK